jgi:hypothetical protein
MKSNLPGSIDEQFERTFAQAKLGFLKTEERKRAFFLGYHACFHGIMNLLQSGPSEEKLAAALQELDGELAEYLRKLTGPAAK